MSTEGERRSISIGVVRLWPDQPNAEMENLQRLRAAAEMLGARVIELDANGYISGIDTREVTPSDVDFVIHMHFETPKCYDAYSYAALWNPLHFYFDWGYERYSGHLASHDDFLSCGSRWADDHVRRLTWSREEILWPLPMLNHTLAAPILPPHLPSSPKLFYCGINWERLAGTAGRHAGLFKELDKKNLIKIYGPETVRGVRVWRGFRNFSGALPFDGKAVVEAIGTCGISLVLSSESHHQSELMSNRLFESIAGGAVVVCDDHPFVRRHFGDTVLYVGDSSGKVTADEVTERFEWVIQHRAEALELARRAQEIFLRKFNLKDQLADIISGHSQRLRSYENKLLARRSDILVRVVIPIYDPKQDLTSIVKSVSIQSYRRIVAEVLLDGDFEFDEEYLANELGVPVKFRRANMFRRGKRTPLGELLYDVMEQDPESLYMAAVPSERWFVDHVSTLVRLFEEDPSLDLAMSDYLLKHYGAEGEEHRDYGHTDVDLGHEVVGCAAVRGRLANKRTAPFFRYLDRRNVVRAWKRISENVAHTNKGTCLAAVQSNNCTSNVDEHIQERILEELSEAFGKGDTWAERPLGLLDTFDRMSRSEREVFAIRSVKALPLPRWVLRMLRWIGRVLLLAKYR